MNEILMIWLLQCLLVKSVWGLDNGLALTPPMGWLSWERFRCNLDCKNDPDNCISENLIMKMADIMASEGYRKAGYEYVSLDDCWLAKKRGSDGQLQPDSDRFPNGIKALADYVHSRGLKLGIYEDFGTKTCAGYPGSEYYLQMDTQTFADWGVDLLKLDGCYSDPKQYSADYPPFAFWLNKTGRPIVLSCEYPLHQRVKGFKPNYPKVATACNMARNFDDINDGWASVISIINFYGSDEGNFTQLATPGYFNDPDELDIGNFGLSYEQERVQMALWAIMASPLQMSTDLRNIRTQSKALLLNPRILAINQDPMGKQGRRVKKLGNIQVWTRPILPEGSYAFAFLNEGMDGTPHKVSVSLDSMGLHNQLGYDVIEVFDGEAMGSLKPSDSITVKVNPTGVFMGRAVVTL